MAVHYRAWTESTLHKFEDTWREQQPLELVLGKGAVFLLILLHWMSRNSLNYPCCFQSCIALMSRSCFVEIY